LVIDHYRSKSGKQTISIDDEENQIDIVDESQDLGEKMDLAIDLEIVKDKLLELKEEYREILILRFINDLDLDEIADVTGKSKGNVRVFLHRALKSLKDLVEKDREKKKL
jgi:RNA polymerase sigma-70 factor (ECF subfamily)